MRRVAIQGEIGSNSHAAALEALGPDLDLVTCRVSAKVFERLASGEADLAVLPIENSLHGSVTEHYDLIREGVAILGETVLRVRHHVIAAPGVRLADLTRISSHPVALAQCRRWLRQHPALTVLAGDDTAGSVKELMAAGWRDAAGIAPELAARIYGAEVLVADIEDHAENWTRFYLLAPIQQARPVENADKMSLAFTLEHRPGTLLEALGAFASAGVNLTRIESRPVPGKPWEYVFFVDLRFTERAQAEAGLAGLLACCRELQVLGMYRAAAEGQMSVAAPSSHPAGDAAR